MLWASHAVRFPEDGHQAIRHPLVGDLPRAYELSSWPTPG
jgi:hypothetical protein